jgi:anhydro-N-acetylmuramic acid kinase
MSLRWIIGLSSGSRADGADAVLAGLEGAGLGLRLAEVRGLHYPYGPELREGLWKLTRGTPAGVGECGRFDRLLGETFAAAARALADRAGASLQKVQCIGCGGHLAWHEPEGRFPFRLDLGMAGVVAERCGVTTVSDFADRDIAAGGHGNPLTALPDYLLFRHPDEGRLLLHLGGVACVTFLPAAAGPGEIAGFEAGPCNVLLDALMRRLSGGRADFDYGGKHAVQGTCIDALLDEWLAHPALHRRPAAGLPRRAFGDDFVATAVARARAADRSLHDLLCTATHFVARCVRNAVDSFLPAPANLGRVLLSGGGSRNGLLLHLLGQQLPGVELERTDALGVPADLRKPLSFALLAALTLDGVPGNVSATGAAGPRLLGSLTPGSSGHWARCLGWMAKRAGARSRSDPDLRIRE